MSEEWTDIERGLGKMVSVFEEMGLEFVELPKTATVGDARARLRPMEFWIFRENGDGGRIGFVFADITCIWLPFTEWQLACAARTSRSVLKRLALSNLRAAHDLSKEHDQCR